MSGSMRMKAVTAGTLTGVEKMDEETALAKMAAEEALRTGEAENLCASALCLWESQLPGLS